MSTACLSVEPFTAVADCPRCGEIAVHWLDQPRRATQQEWDDYERAMDEYDPFAGDSTRIVAWSGDPVRTVTANPAPNPPLDERFTIARVCRSCSHRWGNS